MSEARTIATTTHGRYLLALPESPGPHRLLMGFHGYGENAEIHLDALRAIPGAEGWALCSVQALHRFYERRTEAVVGSWMTRQDRELAIEDNVGYVRQVLAVLRSEPWWSGTLVFAGFSQGVAMAYRAAAFAGHASAGLIALAGDVPPDVLATPMHGFPRVLAGTGTRDAWYTPARLEADVARLVERGIAAQAAVFEGGHEWTDAFRVECGEFLRSV